MPTEVDKKGSAQAKLTSPTLQSGSLLKSQTAQDDTLKVAVSPPWLLTLPRKFPLPTSPIRLLLYAGPDDATSLGSAINVFPFPTKTFILVLHTGQNNILFSASRNH